MLETIDRPFPKELAQRLFDLSLVRKDEEFLTGPDGIPVAWLLDARVPMLMGEAARDVGITLADRLRARGTTQIAGYGLGAFPVVCSVLNAPGSPPLRGGFIREERKKYGRHRLVEGPLQRHEPIVVVDDILNSGSSAVYAVEALQTEGYQVKGVAAVFEYTWSQGRKRLEEQGLWVESLVDLCIGSENSKSRSDSV